MISQQSNMLLLFKNGYRIKRTSRFDPCYGSARKTVAIKNDPSKSKTDSGTLTFDVFELLHCHGQGKLFFWCWVGVLGPGHVHIAQQ